MQIKEWKPLTSHKKRKIKKSHQMTLSEVLKDIIDQNERKKPQSFTVMGIAYKYNVEHRRVYDFFNLLTALGVCKVITKGQLSWVGLQEVEKTLISFYENIEIESIKKPLNELFNLGLSPSLGILALNFFALFLFLNVKTLSVKQVSKLFHNGKSDIRSLERRLYLALSFLEVVGIVMHPKKTGSYTLVIDRTQIVENALQKRSDFSEITSLEHLLAKPVESLYVSLYSIRRMDYLYLTYGK